jgi:hypothetical protein
MRIKHANTCKEFKIMLYRAISITIIVQIPFTCTIIADFVSAL